MRSVMNAQQMRAVDKYMIEKLHIPSLVLMENAAMGTARLVMEKKPEPCVVHTFCGIGNNGGDGFACARILLARGYDVYVAVVGDPSTMKGDARANYEMFRQFPDRVLEVSSIEDLYSWRVPKAEVIVDALFGVGLSRDVLGVYADVIASMNSAQALRVSMDIPSGIDADTGRVMGIAVRADCTATFQYPKVGQYLYPGRQYTGELRVVTIGIDKGVEDVVASHMFVYDSNDPDILIPMRSADSNKGTYGRLLLVAGSRGMAGAAVMSAKAAYASGAGLVTVAAPWAVVDVMQNSVPEATCALMPEEEGRIYSGSADSIRREAAGKTAVAVGPGLGSGKGLKTVVADMLTTYDVCRVVDADALNALDQDLKVLAHIRGDVVFTPHPREFARLLGTDLDSVLEHPVELATAFAQKCRVTVVLKGATTIIASADGDVTLVAAGSPGMAKAGSGDVLTGTIAGFAAQGVPGYEAAVLGVYLCSVAGEAAAEEHGEYSSTPNDTIQCLGRCIKGRISNEIPAWRVTVHEASLPSPYPSGGAAETQHAAHERSRGAVSTAPRPEQSSSSIVRASTGASDAVVHSAENGLESIGAQALPHSDASAVGAEKNASPEQETHDALQKKATAATEHDIVSQTTDNARHDRGLAALMTEERKAADVAIAAVHHEGPERVRNASSVHEMGTPVSPAVPRIPVPVGGEQTADSTRRPDTSHDKAEPARMSARDVRPPRMPVQAAQGTRVPAGDTTKVVESLQETLSEAAKEPKSSAETTRQQKRAERRHAEKASSRHATPESQLAPTAPQENLEETEARKRDRLNQEIQKELNKKKGQTRTRRRIG